MRVIPAAAMVLLAASPLLGRELSPSRTLMRFDYGTGPGQLDTLRADRGAPWPVLVQAYRVEGDHSVWILSAASAPQTLRRFRSDDGAAACVETVHLPQGEGRFQDFLFTPSGLILSEARYGHDDQAIFYRVSGDSILERVVLPRDAGYNQVRGHTLANLGRLYRIGNEVCNCYPPNSSCVRIGGRSLARALSADSVLPGVPIQTGELVWTVGPRFFVGFLPVADLSDSPSVWLEEVFLNGDFVVGSARTRSIEELTYYYKDGRIRGEIVPRQVAPGEFQVGDGESLYCTARAVYQLLFDGSGGSLLQYYSPDPGVGRSIDRVPK